ncbi:MAG: polysaccharide biosynthesis protein [bacterium]|nr:polysaccharide biosynthesis protein [bacterium]
MYKKFIWDLVGFSLAPFISFLIRFDFQLSKLILYYPLILRSTLLETIFGLIVIVMFKPYKDMWCYTSIKEVEEVSIMVLLEKVCFVLLTYAIGIEGFPRSIFVISFGVSIFIILLPRFIQRYFRESRSRLKKAESKDKVLIIGAGEAGEKLLREIYAHPELGYDVIGFIDDDERKIGNYIHSVKILGDTNDIPKIVNRYDVDTIIVSIPSASRKDLQRIHTIISKTKAKELVTPGLYEILGGDVSISTLRPFGLQDLLFREPIKIDIKTAKSYLGGKRILVTGACGSIGRVITQHLVSFGAEVIGLDNNETGLFDLDKDLGKIGKFTPVIGDVRFKETLDRVIGYYSPEIVFHTAAYKHVPLMEIYPEEAVLTNVVGTLNLIESCQEKGVRQMINISTDKAVEPTNMLGLTKRLTEIMSIRANGNGTCFSTVRFGNVLGSRGNVLEVWKKELLSGQPLSITSPNMKRYFMLTEEASLLVIEASRIAGPGELFILDMGEPIFIEELAKIFCELQGLELHKDVSVRYIGVRPGEKIEEKLWADDEKTSPTAHPRIIKVISPVPNFSWDEIKSIVKDLEMLAKNGDREKIKKRMKEIVVGKYELKEESTGKKTI